MIVFVLVLLHPKKDAKSRRKQEKVITAGRNCPDSKIAPIPYATPFSQLLTSQEKWQRH